MKRFVIVLGLVVAGCSTSPEKIQYLTPGSRVIYHGGKYAVYTICDRGDRIYFTETGHMQVVHRGCPTGEP